MGTTLTQLTRLPVRASGGEHLGRVLDVGIDAPTSAPAVEYLHVGGRGRPSLVLPWALVASSGDQTRGLRLAARVGELGRFRANALRDVYALRGPRLWLGRDVLDSQVVDLTGSRLSRVSEVYLVRQTDGTWVVTAVDLGLGALLGRVGLGWIGQHLSPVAVAWDDLYLASTAGHSVELNVSAQRLRRLDPSTVAEIIARLRTEYATDVLRAVDPQHAATALAASHEGVRRGLLHSLSADQKRHADRRFLRTRGWRVLRPRGVKQ